MLSGRLAGFLSLQQIRLRAKPRCQFPLFAICLRLIVLRRLGSRLHLVLKLPASAPLDLCGLYDLPDRPVSGRTA